MLGLSCYNLGHFDKTVAWCTRAFTLYTRVLRGSLFNADYYNHWFVIENLYSLGTAYATMNFFEKAVYYLNLGRNLINGCEVSDRQDPKQHVKVLRALADSHASMEESDVALRFYEEAVQISRKLGENNSKTALQNQLLNSMASVNVDSKNYEDAENNLEQALDYQKDVEMSIKLDMVAVLKRLGATSVLACDVDKAIGCYKDCIQATRELRWMSNQWEDITCMLCTLATLYHVKSCMLDDENQMELFMTMSEGCFQEAIAITEDNPLDIRIEVECAVDLQYANFLYQQGLYADALHVLLPTTFGNRPQLNDLVYSGIEQAVLPDHLQSDFYDDSMIIDAKTFAYLLAILCYKNIGLISEADDVLVMLYKSTLDPHSKAFLCNICGYALLEMGMYLEACEIFFYSATVKSVYTPLGVKTAINFYIILCLHIYNSLVNFFHTVYNLLQKLSKKLHSSKYSSGKKDFENESISSIVRQLSSQDESDLAFCSDSGEEMVEIWEEWTEDNVPDSKKVHWSDKSFTPNKLETAFTEMKQTYQEKDSNIQTKTFEMKKTENNNKLIVNEQHYQQFTSVQQRPLTIQEQGFSPHKFSESSTFSNTSDYSSQVFHHSREKLDEFANINEDSNEDEDEISETFEEIVYDTPSHMAPSCINNEQFRSSSSSDFNICKHNIFTSSTNSSDTLTGSNNNLEKIKIDEHNKKINEMSVEINGNLTSYHNVPLKVGALDQPESDSLEDNEEWVTIEEVVDTPIEILAILNRNNKLNSFNNGNNNINNANNKNGRYAVGLYV
ncbi:hypothetical protein HELRODRAFT_193150 [Helobdella robusta]|uniref:Uncharacterized protein n=1 Tax=Helobdella robusta TaxID=6412 RepID=T1FUN8_HELRO|nr:hypothetical protein HELRODRAFT_193150 [Helobdella robusta]ESN97934.1 hypothetical protein HELRODRAFT_193150 [Helobdella robusta]